MRTIVVGALLASFALPAAADLGSCADALDKLHREARDASEAAHAAESAKSSFESCRNMASFGGGSDCYWERSAVKDAIRNFSSAMDDVERAVRNVNASCS
jgi:hypothetical protein